jgi:hypothetical protein
MSKKNKKMAVKKANQSLPNKISWEFPEYQKHDRNRNWYIVAGIIALGLIVYALFSANYFFALIILLVGFIIVFLQNDEPLTIQFSLEPTGVRLVDRFYSYDVFKDFSIVFKPEDEIRTLYFEFKNGLRHRMSIPLQKTNPLIVRQYLLRYLIEDLERNDAPFSDGFAKTFKI